MTQIQMWHRFRCDTNSDSDVTQMLKLSDKIFKITMINMSSEGKGKHKRSDKVNRVQNSNNKKSAED